MLGMIDRLRIDLLFDKGVRFTERGNYAGGLRHFDAVIDSRPIDALAQGNRGFCLLQLGRQEEAVAAYQRAAELGRDDPTHAYDLACLYAQLDRINDAIAAFQMALFVDPDFAPASLGLAELTGERPVGSDPPADDNGRDRCEAAFGLFGQGRYEEALQAFDEAVAAGHDDEKMQNNRAAVLIELKRHKEALSACDAALSRNAHYSMAHLTRGEALVAMGRQGQARAELAFLEKADPGKAQVLREMLGDPQAPANGEDTPRT